MRKSTSLGSMKQLRQGRVRRQSGLNGNTNITQVVTTRRRRRSHSLRSAGRRSHVRELPPRGQSHIWPPSCELHFHFPVDCLMTPCESAANCNPCLRAFSVSAGRRPDSGYSPPSRSSEPSTLRPIAGGDYHTRKPSSSMRAAQNSCSRSTAAAPLTVRRDGTWAVTSIILVGRTRRRSGAKAASCSSHRAVSNRARKLPSIMGRNIIASLSRTAAAGARPAAPRRPNAERQGQQRNSRS